MEGGCATTGAPRGVDREFGVREPRMRHARRRVVRRVTRLAAVGGLLLGGTMVTRAMASETPAAPAPHTYAQQAGQAGTMGEGLVRRLGPSRTAGTWIG